MEYHTDLCHAKGSFLPPWNNDVKHYPRDGLHRRNVEYYSGGIQL